MSATSHAPGADRSRMTSLTPATFHSSLELKPVPRPPAGDCTRDSWASYFDSVYRNAAGETAMVPWADAQANPCLVSWLNAQAPGLVRPGATVTVVGCGLGDDVAELAGRGYDVIGFDCSACAIDWARRRHPALADRFMVADLMELPPSLRRRADLVVEVSTIQSVDPMMRPSMASAIASLARPRGLVLAIARGRASHESLDLYSTPPYPLTSPELMRLLGDQGFSPIQEPDEFLDDEQPPKRRLRGAFRRS